MAASVTVRTRAGGERIRLADDRPRRALKGLLQDAGMPPWQRESLPLVFCGDALAVVPGIGVDVAFQAAAGASGWAVRWHPGVANVDVHQLAGHSGRVLCAECKRTARPALGPRPPCRPVTENGEPAERIRSRAQGVAPKLTANIVGRLISATLP